MTAVAELNRRLAASDTPEAASGGLLAEMQRLRQLKNQPLAPKSDQDG